MHETLFGLINASVLPAWAALLLAPRWRHTQALAVTVTVALVSCAYVALVAYALVSDQGAEGVDFTTMAGVAAIFSAPLGVLAGWAHYLAFDLFVGAWIVRDARARGIPHRLAVPAIALCFLAGPAGYLLHRIVRTIAARRGKRQVKV